MKKSERAFYEALGKYTVDGHKVSFTITEREHLLNVDDDIQIKFIKNWNCCYVYILGDYGGPEKEWWESEIWYANRTNKRVYERIDHWLKHKQRSLETV